MSVVKRDLQEITYESGYLTRPIVFGQAKKFRFNEWIWMPKGTGFKNWTNPRTTIWYFIRGEGNQTIGSKDYVVKAGSASYVPPNTPMSLIVTKDVLEGTIVYVQE